MSSSNPPEEVWRAYLEWAHKIPDELPDARKLGAPSLADIFERNDIDALMRYNADQKLYEENLKRYFREERDGLEALEKWFNWNDWCTGVWKAERIAQSRGTSFMSLAIDIADTLVPPGGKELRFTERNLLINALISNNRSSPAVINIIDRITSRSELLAKMAKTFLYDNGGLLETRVITAITEFQDDYPVFTRTEGDDLSKFFSGFDSDSLGVVAQMTLHSTNNADAQKKLLAGGNVYLCWQ